jgi:hypothetical protein
MPVRVIKKGGGKKLIKKGGSKVIKGGNKHKTQKGGNNSSSTCKENTVVIGDSCISWLHITVVIVLIALAIFTIYVYMEDRRSGVSSTFTLNGKRVSRSDNSQIRNDVNININNQEQNPSSISYADQINRKNHERIINPLLPPERSYVNTYGIPINIPSRGVSGGYQQIGVVYKNEISDDGKTIGNNSESVILPLFGQPTYPGSNKWNYYTTSDKFNSFKMPITIDGRKCTDDTGCTEIYNGDNITLPAYNGNFKVEIYDFDKPKYIPFQY